MGSNSCLLFPGARIDRNGYAGTIGAVGFTGGERYYWLTLDDGGIAMLPAIALEEEHEGDE